MKSKNKKAIEQFSKRFVSQIPGELVLGPVTVSKLNPDGSKTILGVVNTPEEAKQFLPKIPPVNKTLYVHCICALRFELERCQCTLADLKKHNQILNDETEEAEVMIGDLQQGIQLLKALQVGEAIVQMATSPAMPDMNSISMNPSGDKQ